jgi:hypothetical protein
MSINTVTLIPFTEHGVPSGNYDGSSEDFFGDAVKGANYYRGRGGLQTIMIRVIGFIGTVTIQGTLDADPLTARWIDTYEYGDGSGGDGSTTDVNITNVQGNFVWLRASVTAFTAGSIESVTASY